MYGNGAIVIVPSPGHTPGWVIILITLPDGKQCAMIGALARQEEGAAEREESLRPQRTVGDNNPNLVRENLLSM